MTQNQQDAVQRTLIQSRGSESPRIYFIADSPDEEDYRLGTIMSGKRGSVLDNFMKSLNVTDYRVWSMSQFFQSDTFNVPNVSTPLSNDEVRLCQYNLLKDIMEKRPIVLVPLGTNPSKWILGDEFMNITSSRGKRYKRTMYGVEYSIVPVFSPSYLVGTALYDSDAYGKFFTDMKLINDIANGNYIDPMEVNNISFALDFNSFEQYYNETLKGQPELGYDIETNAELVYSKDFDIIGFSLAKKHHGVYVSLDALDLSMTDEDKEKSLDLLVNILEETEKVVVHNSNYERPATYHRLGYELPFEKVEDTLVMAKLLLGGKIGAGLKDNAQAIGYPEWEADAGEYIQWFKTILKRIGLVKFTDMRNRLLDNQTISFILNEYKENDPGAIDSCWEIIEYFANIRKVLARYYPEDEIENVLDLASLKVGYGIQHGIPGTIPYNWIPYRILCKYGAIDSLATVDLKEHFLTRFERESTDDVDLLKGYYHFLSEHYAGYAMMMSGLNWDDNAAQRDLVNFRKICVDALSSMVRHPVVIEQIINERFDWYMPEIVYENYNDYFFESFDRKVIASKVDPDTGDVIEYKIEEYNPETGKTKKRHIKHLMTDIKLSDSVEKYCRQKITEKIKKQLYATTSLDELKGWFNPASTVEMIAIVANKVIVTSEFKFAALIKGLQGVISKDEFNIDNFYGDDLKLIEMVIEYTKINSSVENFSELRKAPYQEMQNFIQSVMDTGDRFMTKEVQECIGNSMNYELRGLDDESQIGAYEILKVAPIDPDNEETWTEVFKWLVDLRYYKKSMKVISSYIEGKVGRNSIQVVDRKSLSEGDDVVYRKRHYRDNEFTPEGKALIADDEATIVQTILGVGTAETQRWRSSFHTLPSGSTVKKLYTSRFKGGTIFQPDFSSNELRCVASVAHEESMLQAFRDGVDIHKSNASKIYNVPMDDVTSFQRRFAKTLSFMTLYGGGAHSMADSYFGGDVNKAQAQLDSFFGAFPALAAWIEDRKREVMETGKVSVLTNKFLKVDFDKNDRGSVGKAMRAASNYPIQSFSHDTLIKGLDGKDHKIGDLADNSEDLWVYSYDTSTNSIVPKKGIQAQCTGETDTWYEITLDNNESVKVTPEHLMMLRDGSYSRADELKPGDSLMPLYLGYNKDWSGNERPYTEIVNSSISNKTTVVHRMVHEAFYPDVDIYQYSVHHIDLDPENNDPYNLCRLSNSAHRYYHANLNEYCFDLDIKRVDDMESALMTELLPTYGLDRALEIMSNIKSFHLGITLSQISEISLKSLASKNQRRSSEYTEWDANQRLSVSAEVNNRLINSGNVLGLSSDDYSRVLRDSWSETRETRVKQLKESHNTPEARQAHSDASKFLNTQPDYAFKRTRKILEYFRVNNLPYSTPEEWDSSVVNYNPKFGRKRSRFILKFFTWSDFMTKCDEYLSTFNHKVVSINVIKLFSPEPKYDLHVPELQNFALSCGVFTHNSASSTIAAVTFSDIIKFMKSRSMKSKPILFIHDSVETDVYPYEIIQLATYQKEKLGSGAEDNFGVACRADLSLGHSLGHEIEVSEIEVLDEKFTHAIFHLEGWRDEIEETLEDWRSVYKTVNIVEEEFEDKYIPMDQTWIPRKSFDPTVRTWRKEGKMKVEVNYYE